jgi:hypothetical protein
MTKLLISFTFLFLIIACAKVDKSPMFRNDSNQVTIGHGYAAAEGNVYKEALVWCQQYGKKAYLKQKIDRQTTQFTCE